MKNVTTQAAQGDIYVRRIDSIPPSSKRVTPVEDRHVVAHSETGHHHYLPAIGVERWEDPADPLRCYLSIESCGAELRHARPFDTHESLFLGGGVWEIRRQREYTPAGWRRAVD